ncbi:DnaJ-domain-containing protein [Calocera viscosa TUFC12733]|uniref:DnaJ-domain-containing protein n=1 Tax=Calocera viscosa (strain TUFC12733) TaxID=1330018 RepID=A0A167QZH1_CALVF|nr:DnaJ-domain-containing protein [Calocera viscosa TUFC12733]
MEKAKDSLDRDYYTILGVPKTANFEDLRMAFRRKALLVHPDRLRTEDAARQFIELHDAYRYLADPTRRARYDRLFYNIDKAAAEKARHAADEPGVARRMSESGLRPHMTAERERRKSTEDVPASPPDPSPTLDPAQHYTATDGSQSAEYPHIDPYPSSGPQPARISASGPSPSEPGPHSKHLRSPRNVPMPPSPIERTPGVPLPDPPPRREALEDKHGRSASAAPPPRREPRAECPSDQAGNATDINIPRPQNMPPPHRTRSRSRPRPLREDSIVSSDTDISVPVYYKPLKAFQPPAPIRKPAAWVFPLGLSLAELYTGCRKRFGITRSLLNGQTEEQFITIDVQPGWTKGTRVTCSGAGSEIEPGLFQDLVFVVRQLPDQRFAREGMGGRDLVGRFGLRLVDALTAGGKRMAKVQTVDGRDVKVRLPDGIIKEGDRAVLPGEGMPIRKGSQIVGKGDLVIEWVILYPDTLTPEQIAAFRLILSNKHE